MKQRGLLCIASALAPPSMAAVRHAQHSMRRLRQPCYSISACVNTRPPSDTTSTYSAPDSLLRSGAGTSASISAGAGSGPAVHACGRADRGPGAVSSGADPDAAAAARAADGTCGAEEREPRAGAVGPGQVTWTSDVPVFRIMSLPDDATSAPEILSVADISRRRLHTGRLCDHARNCFNQFVMT